GLEQAPRLQLPVQRDLRRAERLLGLRATRRRAEAEPEGGLVGRHDRAPRRDGGAARRAVAVRDGGARLVDPDEPARLGGERPRRRLCGPDGRLPGDPRALDRKSTRLNSSHVKISYAVFCWKKKKEMSPKVASHIMILSSLIRSLFK